VSSDAAPAASFSPLSAKLFAINSSRMPPHHKPLSGAKSGLGIGSPKMVKH
jgi:hypothetical protein